MTDLLLGADVGGSTTRVAVGTVADGILQVAYGGPGNPNVVGLAASAQEIRRTTARALTDLPGVVVAAVIGLAGGTQAAGDLDYRTAALPAGLGGPTTRFVSDLAVTFSSATPRWQGCTLIAGTGAVAARVVGEDLQERVDGWGWLLGDRGSGFWLGRAAVRATLQVLDDGTVLSGLHRDVLSQAGASDHRELLRACYASPPTWLAGFAPLVSRWAEDDPVAAALADRAADLLAETLSSLRPGPGEPVVLGGSVLSRGSAVRDRLPARLAPEVALLQAESGTVGAVFLAARGLGLATEQLHARLRRSAATAPRR